MTTENKMKVADTVTRVATALLAVMVTISLYIMGNISASINANKDMIHNVDKRVVAIESNRFTSQHALEYNKVIMTMQSELSGLRAELSGIRKEQERTNKHLESIESNKE